MTLQKIKNGWALFKKAVAGDGEIDYTEGSIGRVTVMLAIPMILEMAMKSIFAVVDIFFVAGLGTAAVATVGLTEAMITLLYAIAIGLSMGTTPPDRASHWRERYECCFTRCGTGYLDWIGSVCCSRPGRYFLCEEHSHVDGRRRGGARNGRILYANHVRQLLHYRIPVPD